MSRQSNSVKYYDHQAWVTQQRSKTLPVEVMRDLPNMEILPALQAQPGAEERTTGTDRAVATVIRTAPMSVVFLVLAVGITFALDLGVGWTLIIFSFITTVGYYILNQLDFKHSRAGLERHRIDAATKIKIAEMRYVYKLRRQALNGFLTALEDADDD